MCELLKNIRWGKVVLAGIIYLAISFVVHQIDALLTIDYYKMPELFGVWSKLMMPKAAPPPLSFFLVSVVFSFLTGITLAVLYEKFRNLFSENKWKRIFNFTCLFTILSIVLFSFPVYLLINVPLSLILIWVVGSLIIFFFTAIAFNKLLK